MKVLLQLPLLLVTWAVELVMSRRGLALAVLAVLAALSWSPWMRPPLSRDIRASQISLGVLDGTQFTAEELMADRPWRYDSVGLPLLVVCACGAVVVLFRPQELHHFTGMVVLLGTMGTAAVMFNHPQLIEAFDSEFEQRLEIQKLMKTHDDSALAGVTSSRLQIRRMRNGLLEIGTRPDKVSHSWMFVLWSPWLVAIALFVTGATVGGTWRHRAGTAGAWLVGGLMFAGLVTSRRWVAEHYFSAAEALENANDYDGAERSLDRALKAMPGLQDTRRMWLARGRLDVRRGIRSVEAMAFEALQRPGSGELENLELAVEIVPYSRTLRDATSARLFAAGERTYLEGSESGAEALWGRALRLAPWRVDCRVAKALAAEHAERTLPEQIEGLLTPAMPYLGDRLIVADMQSLIGDAYFEAGRLEEARRHYDASMETFSLPRVVNTHAQEALLGM